MINLELGTIEFLTLAWIWINKPLLKKYLGSGTNNTFSFFDSEPDNGPYFIRLQAWQHAFLY